MGAFLFLKDIFCPAESAEIAESFKAHTDLTETTDTFIPHSSCRKHFTATERAACVTLRASFQDDTNGFL